MSAFFRFHLGVCLFVLSGMHCAAFAADPDVTVRQVVIRAPESRVVKAMLANPDDEALAKILFAWVDDGTAKIVSELSGLHGKNERAVARSGRLFQWVTENDQDFDKALLIPNAWTDVFIGTSLEAAMGGPESDKNNPGIAASWNAFFSPRDPQDVLWPAWWPTIPEPKVNWYPQQDFYVEKVVTAARFVPQGTVILGIMPRADHLEVDLQQEKTLDVVMAQVKPQEPSEAPAKGAGPPGPSYHSRLTVLGFGLNDREALELLQRADLEHDKVLLDEFLKQTAAGKVSLRTCNAVSQLSGQRASLESSREHSYPTEMPTIPSAWMMRPVGTILETDYAFPHALNISLEQHPSFPRRAEWRCALDSPALIMWQPQFFVQKIQAALSFGKDSVVFLGAMRTPDCHRGMSGITPGETLVLFAKLDESTPHSGSKHAQGVPIDPFAPNPGSVSFAPPSPRIELEAVVFEVPAKEAASWSVDPTRVDDGDRFTQLMSRAKSGTAQIVAHVAVPTMSGQRATVSTIEEVITVTELDPPEPGVPGRYRPTALESIPCGTSWAVEAVMQDPIDASTPEVHLRHKLQHHVASPIEPGYQEMIKDALKNQGSSVLKATLFEETWDGEIILKPGVTRFIGFKHPPGDAFKDKLHLAFVRARVAK